MNRVLLSLISATICGTVAAGEPYPQRPNIVVILSDDMGF